MRILTPTRKITYIVLLCVMLVAVGVVLALFLNRSQPEKQKTAEQTTEKRVEAPVSANPTVRFAAMGDMLAHDSVVNQAKTADGYDFTPYFTSITPLLKDSDVVFCNPETPSAGIEYDISGYPTFNAPTEFARDLRKTGCDVINLASNHMADKGQGALNATLDVWKAEKPVAMAGANRSAEEQNTVQYFEKNGIKTAFLAFADFSNAALPHSYSINSYHDEALVRRLMTEARAQADAVVVSMHWGTEDSHIVNNDQRAAAQLLANLGADVIIGTGPHVLQPVEWVEGENGHKTLVWYSIGNMLSSQLQVDELTGGVAQFRIARSDGGIVVSDVSFRPTFMSYEWSAADRAADNLLARRNLKLQPLTQANAETGLFGVSVDERMAKVREWLGSEVNIIE